MISVVIGSQWGDEGKGKIVDFLSQDADIIVRYSGGANAGHTIVTGKDTYKLHLVPSGIIYPDTAVCLGSGMVIDPESLFSELETIEKQGIDWTGRVFISDRAHFVLPRYKKEEVELEKQRSIPIGTTGRGIGSAYAHKAYRDGIRLADLLDEEISAHFAEEDRRFLEPFKSRLKKMAINLVEYLHDKKGKNIMFEGAQGILLDLDIGTYPYVSSGMSSAAGVAGGGGIGPRDIDSILGVFKAYSTRVGNGPFPSEFDSQVDGELEEMVRETGREYGVTTGRPRRCGYLDLVALKYACQANSLDNLVLTHIDVYDELEEIKACVAYEIDGEEVSFLPSSVTAMEKAKPVVKTFKGWKTPLTNCSTYEELPEAAKEYIRFIEDYTGTDISIISVGYRRSETIMRKAVWTQ